MKQSLAPTGTPEATAYLFSSPLGTVEFIEIDEDMAQLNDFCVHFLSATCANIQELEHESRHGQGGVFQGIGGEELDISIEDVRDGAAVQLDVWQDTGEFLARANCLLLLACFTEKSLLSLCKGMDCGTPRARPGQSKVAACLDFLKEKGGLTFEEPELSIQVRKQCSQVRNFFAHGDWDNCREQVRRVELPSAFAAVTSLLRAIEQAHTGHSAK